MTTQWTQDLIKSHGWTFVPEHDIRTGRDMMVDSTCPESWTHDEYGITLWSVDEVLSSIRDEIANS